MAHERALDMVLMSVPLPIHVRRRAEKRAAEQGKALSRFIAETVAAAVVDVSLTVEDYAAITEYVEKQRELRMEKRERRNRGKG